jgi:glutamine phosphoribosylpyrophosphate amidotransferase
MCGLFGIFNFNKQELTLEQQTEFTRIADLNIDRGPVGAGFLELSTTLIDSVHKYQHEYWPSSLKRDVKDKLLNPYALLGHCRAPTGGSKEFLHPDSHTTAFGKSFFAHNGMILDIEKLKLISGIKSEKVPDSIHLHRLFVSIANVSGNVDISSFLSSFDIPGSYTFWWYYMKHLVLARNQGTLYLYETPEGVSFSSVKHKDESTSLRDGDIYICDGSKSKIGHFLAHNPLL